MMRDMLARDHGASATLNRIHDVFPLTDDLTLLVSVPPDDAGGAETGGRLVGFARSLESAIRSSATLSPLVVNITHRADTPDSARVFVERYVVPNGLLYLTEEGFTEARRRLTGQAMVRQIARNERLMQASSPAAGAIADTVLRDPLRLYELIDRDVAVDATGVGPLLSPDGRSLLIRITGTHPAGDLEFCRRIVQGVRDAVDRLDPHGISVDYTGAYAITDLSARTIRRDMTISIAGSLVLIQVLFLVAYRHGLSFALACDIRIASERASFIEVFINVGLVPDSGSTWTLPRLVGLGKAMELCFTGDKIDAAEALRIGLVNRVVPADDLVTEVNALAGRIAALPARGIALTKRLLNQSFDNDLGAQLEAEAFAQETAALTEDHYEGVVAFIEKRKPRFKGA